MSSYRTKTVKPVHTADLTFLDLCVPGQTSHVVAMDTGPAQEEPDYFEDVDAQLQHNVAGRCEGNAGEDERTNLCPPGAHAWHEDLCMVCTVCGECTGYSISCLSSMSSDRNPGQ